MAHEYTYKSFELYYPRIAEEVVNYYYTDKIELIVETTNGDRYLYDEIFNTIRKLPSDSGNMSKDEYRNDFGARLFKIMTWKSINQEELSKRTGIPQSAISKYINGEREPGFFKVDKIAKALGCSIEELQYLD